MNLILIDPCECQDGQCMLTDSRAIHLRTVLHVTPGSVFQLGLLNGPVGIGTVTDITVDFVIFTVNCQTPALPPWYDLVLAIPRPRSLRRILFQSAAMGVRNILLVGAEKVEKSYFSMHLLRKEEYRPVLIEGLMQGKTTAIPKVSVIPRFRDLWNALPADTGLRLIANPAPNAGTWASTLGTPLIAVGPDGGWTGTENDAFATHGFQPITLGPRPLRTDTAAIALPAVVQDRLTRYLSFSSIK